MSHEDHREDQIIAALEAHMRGDVKRTKIQDRITSMVEQLVNQRRQERTYYAKHPILREAQAQFTDESAGTEDAEDPLEVKL